MPKKQPGIAVRVQISLPRCGQIEATIFVDPNDIIFTTPPRADQVTDLARGTVLDQLEVTLDLRAGLSLPGSHELIGFEVTDETGFVEGAAKIKASNLLRVKVLNAREVLAEVKAFQAKQKI